MLLRPACTTLLGAVLSAGCGDPPPPRADLHVINNSGADIDILIDGQVVETGIPSTAKEDRNAARWLKVPLGMHTLETKDGTGKVLDTQAVNFTQRQYLFAPAHGRRTCFGLRTDTYDTAASAPFRQPGFSVLEPTRSFWEMTEHVDTWWQNNPTQVASGEKGGTVKLISVRQFTCGDP